MRLPTEIVSIPHDPENPERTEVDYRIAWARTYLKKAGLLTNPVRGAWTTTEEGRNAGWIDPYALSAQVAEELRDSDSDSQSDPDSEDEPQLLGNTPPASV